MKYCLRCGKEHKDAQRIACMCGLEIEVLDVDILLIGLCMNAPIWQTRYHNIFDVNWKHVPPGCLLVITEEEL